MKNDQMRHLIKLVIFLVVLESPWIAAQPIILNEFNAVGSTRLLKDGAIDTTLGAVVGNGGNWIEFVVVEDHADVRGLELRWAEETTDLPANPVWDESRPQLEQGIIRFTDHPLWSDLRAGTILTLAENDSISNSSDEMVVSGSQTSFDPASGDWWIHVWTLDASLIETQTNAAGDGPGNFSVGNDNWEISLYRSATPEAERIWGPIGEAYAGFGGGIGSDEIGKLEVDPSPSVTNFDFNDGSSSSFGAPNLWSAGTITQDFTALRSWVSSEPTGVDLAIRLENQNVILSWQQLPGLEYRLDSSPNISSPSWKSLKQFPMILDDASEISESIPIAPDQTFQFYRVQAINPM